MVRVKRIDWIDAVKGMAILGMVIGHSIQKGPGEQLLYLLIYSFHMPIFFIMSGYTTKILNNQSIIFRKMEMLIKKLGFPIIVIVIICTLERTIFHIYRPTQFLRVIGSALLFANPGPMRGHFTIDAMWFLVVFIWSKLFFYFVTAVIDLDYAGVIFGLLAYICSVVSNKIWLIQSLDLVPISCFYMWLGAEFHHYEGFVNKIQVPLFLMTFGIWIFGLQNQYHIDMAVREFPDFYFSLIFVSCASYCVINIAKGINKTKIGSLLSFFGRETLPFLYANTIDFFWWWGSKFFHGWAYLTVRLLLDIVIMFVLIWMGKVCSLVSKNKLI